MDDERVRLRLTRAGMVVLAAMVVGILAWGPAADRPPKPVTNELFDGQGELTKAMPVLADDITVERNDDGSATVALAVRFDVAHPGKATPPSPGSAAPKPSSTAKPDMAVLTVMVSPHQGTGGPIRLQPMFRQAIEDRALTEASTTHDYEVRLPPKTVDFLDQQGLDQQGDERTAALRFIDIDVQHLRDYQVVDGRYDWQQGRAYTAADEPVKGSSVTNDSTVTVTNATDEGVAGPNQQEVWDEGTTYGGDGWDWIDDTDAYGTNIALSGAAVECIDQGDGSNPQGFSMLNGWDLQDDLPPGFLPPGGAITQQVNADEGLGTTSLDVAENTTAATVQVLAAVGDYATGGAKDAATYGYMVALGVEEISDAATVALGVPIMAIMGLAEAIYQDATNSCASFANVFNLTAVEPDGAQTSISWGDQTDGLDLTYESASHDGTAVTDNVQTIPSNQLVASSIPGYADPVAYHPYLEQQVSIGCGTGSSSNSEYDGNHSCEDTTSGNNVIDVQWANLPPCPYEPAATACTPTAEQNASVTEIDIPGTDLCGTDNELCPPVAAPNSDAVELTPAQAEVGDTYQVVDQFSPFSAVTAMTQVEDGTIWVGTEDGQVQQFDGEAFNTYALSSDAAITGMGASDDTLVWIDGNGDLYELPFDQSPPEPERVWSSGGTGLDHLVADGDGGWYFAAGPDLYAYSSPGGDVDGVGGFDAGNLSITSTAASADDLYVGFQGGEIWRCSFSECAGSWKEVHDDGFDSDAQAMTTVGDTLYVGLANGAQAQIDPSTGATAVYVGPQSEGGTVAGMASVDGNVFVGGCIGVQSPASGDLLGIEVLTALDGAQPTFTPEPDYQDCQNPTATTTKYNGFDAAQYVLTSTPATSTHPPLVYVAISITQQNFFYVLESTALFTDALCTTGTCPEPPPAPTPPAPPGPPPSSLEGIGAPVVAATCGSPDQDDWSAYGGDLDGTYAEASSDDPLTTAPGESVTTGFALTPVTSDGQTCTTTWGWNLNVRGELPYEAWQGNAYPAASTPGSQVWSVGTSMHEPIPMEVGGKAVTEGSTDPSGSTKDLPQLTTVEVGADGSQLQAAFDETDAFVLQATVADGGKAPTLVVNADTLTATGQAVPPPVDLFGAASAPTATTSTTSTTDPGGSSTTSTSSATTTTTSAATTTTTQPPACRLPALPAVGTGGAVWPLDDRTTAARDVSGNGNDATIANAAAYDQAPGPLASCSGNGALQFDGATTSVTAPDGVDVAVDGDELTVAAFVKVPEDLSGTTATVLANDDPATTGDGVSLSLAIDDGAVTGTTFAVGLPSQTLELTGGGSLAPGTWHLLVGTWDAASGQMLLFVDGGPAGTYLASSTGSSIEPGADALTIGAAPTLDGDWFEGLLADVVVLPRSVTASQVASLWAASQAGA